MAGGGKETPRQRMIGMMYLVLTALLALQVSNAVLEKFVFIDRSLQNSLQISRTNASFSIEGIKGSVEKNGNRADDKLVLDRANEVKRLTDEMIKELATIRKDIEDKTGGYDELGNKVESKDYDKINLYMLGKGEGGDGHAYKVRPKLNKFLEDIIKLDTAFEKEFKDLKPFCKDPKDIKEFANDPNQKDKNWERMSFENTPTVAALAVMSQINNEVAKVETKAIDILAKRVGATMIKFDKIMAKVTAESRFVAAGTKYKAQMFIAATSSTLSPKMTSTAGGVKVDQATGVGEVEFTATGGAFDKEGKVKKTWKGSITIANNGKDTTFSVEEEYTVVKPVIDVQAAAVSALYLNCGNELNIQVPALGAIYDPSISASDGAQVIKGAQKGMVTIVPKSAKVKISVSSGGNYIGDKEFKVRLIPKPEIEVQAGGKAINEKTGGPCPRSLRAKVIADESFKAFLPKDARYRVTKWKVSLARGKRLITEKAASGEEANLSDIASQAQSGTDRLVIEIEGVERMNFQGTTEKVQIGQIIKTYPIN